MAKEQPDRERCGTGDRGRAIYNPIRVRAPPPNGAIDEDGTMWVYGYKD